MTDSAPSTRRELVIDELHGQRIEDPYRWLEDGDSPETIAWVEAQNAYGRRELDAIAGRDRIGERLSELLSIGDISAPVVRGVRYFYRRRDGAQNQPTLYWREGHDGADRVLLDPNQLNSEGTTALDWWYPSKDGALLAYGLSESGDERSTLKIREVESGRDLQETIAETRAASLAWLPDNSGFYYTRYPAAGEVPEGEEVYHRRVFFHRLGDAAAADLLIFGADRDAQDWPSVQISDDGRYLLVTVNRGWDRSDVYLRDERAGPGPFIPIMEGEHALASGEVVDGLLYLHTNLDSPRYRMVAIEPSRPGREFWREIVPERPAAVLEGGSIIAGQLLLLYLVDACSRLEVHDLDGAPLREIPLPAIGSIEGLTGESDGGEAFFRFASYNVPPTVYRYVPETSAVDEWARVEAPVQTDDYEVRREVFASRDETMVSMFVVARKGLILDGNNPTVLNGYGGFNIGLTPTFMRSLFLWLERGGVYAVAHLRGGSEYGEEWHQAGMLGKKQNVFDDFIAAAEHLVAAGYTRPSRLAITGGSNGGLLVGAALTQRPDLFRAAVCAVPLLDMLRYHQFQIARLWIAEYGSAEDSEQFQWLWAYSPYQHVGDGVRYPAVLLLTADSDSRVDPLHARKMTARLQAATGSGLPILLRVEFQAGHGAGRPLVKTLAEQTDQWSFLCWQLGVRP